jgi:GxxExxY protein
MEKVIEQGEGERGRFVGLTERIIGACIEVHRALGPGLLESVYEVCLARELSDIGIAYARQVPVPVSYKGVHIDCGFRLDLLVDGQVLVELKAVERLLKVHVSQTVTYLKLTGVEVGLLVNFNVPCLVDGVRRLTGRKSKSPPLPLSL